MGEEGEGKKENDSGDESRRTTIKISGFVSATILAFNLRRVNGGSSFIYLARAVAFDMLGRGELKKKCQKDRRTRWSPNFARRAGTCNFNEKEAERIRPRDSVRMFT